MYRPRSIIQFTIDQANAPSLPGRREIHWSHRAAVSLLVGSMQISLVPRARADFKGAWSTLRVIAILLPHSSTTSELTASVIEWPPGRK